MSAFDPKRTLDFRNDPTSAAALVDVGLVVNDKANKGSTLNRVKRYLSTNTAVRHR